MGDPPGAEDYHALCSVPVNSFHRDLVEEFIGLFLLLQRLLEKLGGLLHAEFLGPRNQRPVPGNLIMLDGLRGRDQARVHDFPGRSLTHHFLAFLDKAFNSFAGPAAGALVHQFEDALKALNLTFRLLEVMLECLLKLRSGGVFSHFRERFQDLLLAVIDVLKRGEKKFLKRAR